MTPPTSRTWSRRGRTPVIRVRGRSCRRLSVAALTCYKPGQRSRLIYRPAPDHRSDGRKSFAWSDYRDLLIAAHRQLGGPIVVILDNLTTHLTAGMRRFIDEHEWLTVFQLPAHSPDLNPVEGIWALLRHTLANTAFAEPGHLIASVRRGLRQIQHRPQLIDGALAGTGLALGNDPPELAPAI
jgi:transposase